MSNSERRWALIGAIVIVGLTCLPYVAAWLLAPPGTVYTGLLVNHYDGESYYAKMQQGARGDWLFHLAFTPEPHPGAAVYTFYLALGQLAGALGLSIPLVYHLARAVAGLFLLLVAYGLIARAFDHVRSRRAAFMVLGLAAGLGWLAAPLGLTTADLWVAEGFTFLGILVNPHFPLAIGLMVGLFLLILGMREPAGRAGRAIGLGAVGGLLLAVVQPFAVPIVAAVLAAYLAALAWQDRHVPWREAGVAGAIALGAAPVMGYDLIVFRTNPALAAWAAQNVTPSLPVWDYALAYGLMLLLAVPGIVAAARRRRPVDLLLLAWVGVTVVLLYVPFALQRRFATGLHVPLALLAAMGLEQAVWPRLRAKSRPLATGLIVGLMALTNVFVALVGVAGVAQGRAPLVMAADDAAAWAWLREHTAWTDTVLAPPDKGEFVPAWAGNRVVYGHPFETIDAGAKQAEVARFYSGEATPAEQNALLARYGVRYVLAGPRDAPVDGPQLVPVWTGSAAVLYRVEAAP